jgi:hypothetical protein
VNFTCAHFVEAPHDKMLKKSTKLADIQEKIEYAVTSMTTD